MNNDFRHGVALLTYPIESGAGGHNNEHGIENLAGTVGYRKRIGRLSMLWRNAASR